MARITGIRRQLSRELGFVVPLVRVRDNLALGAQQLPHHRRRRRRRRGRGLARGSARARFSGDLLEPGRRPRGQGSDLRPRRGLDPARRSAPRRSSPAIPWSIPATVVATHLNQIIQTAAADLFGMDEAQKLLDALKESAPQLVAEPDAAAADASPSIAAPVPRAARRGRAAQGFPPHRRGDGRRRPRGERSGPARRGGPPADRRADRPDAGAGADAAAGGDARRRPREPAHPGGPHRPRRQSTRSSPASARRIVARGRRGRRPAARRRRAASPSSPRRSRAARCRACWRRICPTCRSCPSSKSPTASPSRSSPSSAAKPTSHMLNRRSRA